MDKETLSNYGWIVICVLILAVMLALATPFGTFVAGAIKSTTAGLFSVNQAALNSTGLIDIGDQSFDDGSGGNGGNGGSGDAGDQGGTGLPAIGTSAEECTWEQIKAISEAGKGDDYFNIGDEKTFITTDGKTIVMEIAAFNADTKSDGTGTAGITWISKSYIMYSKMDTTTYTNGNGWVDTYARNMLQTDFYNKLPDEVKNAIETVDKTYYAQTGRTSNSVLYGTKTCADNLWIPSFNEVFGYNKVQMRGPREDSGVVYDEYFKDEESLKKGAIWWLRSENSNSAYELIHSDGYPMTINTKANVSEAIVLGLCT